MKRAIIYVRVSTTDQADNGYSLSSQLAACRLYAERLGFEVVAELSEDYSGATAISERPEGKKLAAMVKARSVDAVIAYQVDRLSRDIVDLLASVRNWLRSGIEVHACDIGKVESELDIVLVIKGWQGSDERKRIIERTSRGRRAKAQGGNVVGSGRALYGYSFVKEERENGRRNAYAINEAEAKIVRLIFQWYVLGDDTGKRVSEFVIAKRLSEMGIANPSASGGRKNPQHKTARASHIWSISTIHYILNNESYTGVWRFGKHIGKNGKGGARPLVEQVPVKIPNIVDRETFESAKMQGGQNKTLSGRNAQYHDYQLRGVVKCGCGSSMYGHSRMNGSGRRYVYYRCSQQTNRFKGLETVCHEKSVTAAVLERFVWNYVTGAVSTSKQYESALRKAQRTEIEMLEPKREQLEILQEQIREDEREFDNIAAELARGVSERVRQALNARAENREPLYNQRLQKRDELQAALRERVYTDERINAALKFREDVKNGIEDATDEDKGRWYHALNVSVNVKDWKARVRCIVPMKAGEIDFSICASSVQQFVT